LIRFRNSETLISNGSSPALRRLRGDALRILSASVDVVDPKRVVLDHMNVTAEGFTVGESKVSVVDSARIYVVGGGKAGAAMAGAVEQLLGSRITGGVVNVPRGTPLPMGSRVKLVEADHPIPSEDGVAGVREMLRLLQGLSHEDVVLCLISGGGSALMPLPAEEISLQDIQFLTRFLLRRGATINELNAVRKHLDAFKGGQLARAASPARVVTLIISDVVGDPLDVIASGPTVPDSTTFHDAKGVLEKYGLWEEAPQPIRRRITRGIRGEVPETPKQGDPVFQGSIQLVIASNRIASGAALREAEKLGYRSRVVTNALEGEARSVGRSLAETARETSEQSQGLPCALIYGGETTVKVTGKGKGGRNQEVALAAVEGILGLDCVVAAFATDGVDGPTDSAGALADGSSMGRSREAGLDPAAYLADNNAYEYWRCLGDHLSTGATGTNVCDISLILVGSRDVC
jgi:hydroxypyruvate reductase